MIAARDFPRVLLIFYSYGSFKFSAYSLILSGNPYIPIQVPNKLIYTIRELITLGWPGAYSFYLAMEYNDLYEFYLANN